jgi:antitoxin HicB
MSQVYRVPLVLTPQPEGGFTVTSPALPGLITEGETLEEALANAQDALRTTLELYEDVGRPLPNGRVKMRSLALSKSTSSSRRGELPRDCAQAAPPRLSRATEARWRIASEVAQPDYWWGHGSS